MDKLKLFLQEHNGKIIVLIVIMAAAVGYGYSKLTGQDDSPLEEAAEAVIKAETGINVDLTPNSVEK